MVGVGVFVGEGVIVGVKVGVGVGVTVGVAVGVGVMVGVKVAVAVGVNVGVGVTVTVGEGVTVGVNVGVAVGATTLFSLSLDSFLCIWKEFPFLACYPGSGNSVSLWCYISVDICMVCVICKLCEVEKTVCNRNSLLPSPAYSSHVPISSPGGQFFWHTALLHRSILNRMHSTPKYTYSFA